MIQLSWPCLNQPSPSGEPDARVREHRRFASAIIFCEYSFRCTCVQVISLVAGTQNVQQPPLGAGVVARRCSNLFYMAGLLRGDTATPPEWRGCCPEVQQPLLSGRSCREGAAAVPVAKVQQPPPRGRGCCVEMQQPPLRAGVAARIRPTLRGIRRSQRRKRGWVVYAPTGHLARSAPGAFWRSEGWRETGKYRCSPGPVAVVCTRCRLCRTEPNGVVWSSRGPETKDSCGKQCQRASLERHFTISGSLGARVTGRLT